MDSLTVETELFEQRDVKPHFINPCCFGEDFAAWLRDRLSGLVAAGFEIGAPIEEDYGWGLWISRAKDTFWIALSFCGDGPTEEPAQWVVSVAYDPGLNLVRRLFHRPDPGGLTQVREAVWRALRTADGICVLDDGTN